MREATLKGVRNAFCSESMSHVRYLIFAGHAQDEAFPSISRLFRAFALAKYLRASELYVMAGDMLETHSVSADSYFIYERTVDNLVKAKDIEAGNVREFFGPSAMTADAEGEAGAAKSLQKSALISQNISGHIDAVLRQLRHAAEEPDIGDIYLCSLCGHISLEVAPEECPCCGSGSEDYILVV